MFLGSIRRDFKPKKTTVLFSFRFSHGQQREVDVFYDGVCHETQLELNHVQKFYEKLDEEGLKLQFCCAFMIKEQGNGI